MSFSTFSKEFTANMFTSVENQFITKYLPQADGDAVKAYLYGLYLCSCAEEFDAEACSKLLRIPLPRLIDIFGFWEECDLVHVLSRDPLYVQYLPVNSAIGKPKPIRAEKYLEFNRELMIILQNAGADFGSVEMQKLIEFLEKYPMEQQALLLIVQYCAQKDGDKLNVNHIINAAKKHCKERRYTYEQVEEVYSGVLGASDLVYAVANKIDYNMQNPRSYREEYIDPWLSHGFTKDQILKIAETCRMWNCHTFLGMNITVEFLHTNNMLSDREIFAFNDLLQGIQKTCSGHSMRLNKRTLDTIASWKSWGFSDAMILEAARRSADVSAPIAYMNKLLSEWKREGISKVEAIPERAQASFAPRQEYKNEAAIAADKRSEREHYYAVLRRRAQEHAEKAIALAESDKAFKEAESAVKRGEIELAKAEVFAPETLPALTEKINAAKAARLNAMKRLGIREQDFLPAYSCKKCSDTGFLPDGRICDCYQEK